MPNNKPETAAPGNRLALPPEAQSRLSLFGRVAVNADLMQGQPLRFHEGMTLDDAVIITGLPRAEAARRIHEMQRQDDPKRYAARHLAEGAGQDPAGQEPQPWPAEAVHLAFWGEDYRAAPNAVFRSALFPALRGRDKENRIFLENADIFCPTGLDIVFTGKQFDQSDLDVYLELLNMAKPFPLGTPIRFTAYALLKALGLSTGGRERAWLHAVLIRLRGGTLEAIDHGRRYFGGLIEGGFRDEMTLEYEITINPNFAVLFGAGMFSQLNLETRRALGRNPTAKALHAYFSTHINPAAHTIEMLCKIAGIHGKNKKATILKAFDALKSAGFMDYQASGNTISPLDISHTPSQNRAIAKKAAQASKAGARRRNAPTLAGDLLPRPPSPKDKK